MKYLAPNDQHQITVPVIVGAEYALPIDEAKLAIRTGGVTTRSAIAVLDSTDITFDITTPDTQAGELKIITVDLTAPTNIGTFKYREVFGVVDTLDIPTDCEVVRSLLGVSIEELPDQDIDLEGKYVEVYKWMVNDFHTLRQNDAYLSKKFGELIALISAIYAAPTLLIRLDKSRKTENGQFQRVFDPKYFQNFLETLEDNLAQLKEDLADYLELPSSVGTSLFEFVSVKQWSINS